MSREKKLIFMNLNIFLFFHGLLMGGNEVYCESGQRKEQIHCITKALQWATVLLVKDDLYPGIRDLTLMISIMWIIHDTLLPLY